MVLTSDHVDLIEELLLGCAPGPDRALRTAIAVGVLRNQDADTMRMLASWFLGAASSLIGLWAEGDPVVYRAKVIQVMGTQRA